MPGLSYQYEIEDALKKNCTPDFRKKWSEHLRYHWHEHWRRVIKLIEKCDQKNAAL